MKAGPHTFSFLNYTKPFGEHPKEFGRATPKASQRQAWADRTAWRAVDDVKGGIDLELVYAVLAGLFAEMLHGNCAGSRWRSFVTKRRIATGLAALIYPVERFLHRLLS
jgi:hypothetical protein